MSRDISYNFSISHENLNLILTRAKNVNSSSQSCKYKLPFVSKSGGNVRRLRVNFFRIEKNSRLRESKN